MSDLISRQAAIDALDVLCQEHRYKIPGKRETYSQYNEAWQDALDRAEGAIFNLPPAQPTIEQDWIPCKKTPPKNDAYLVTVHPDYIVPGGGQVDILVWVDDGWFYMVYDTKTARYQITRFPDPVIAWRPLPAPYKEDHNEP